jgi:hypothetical protein
MPTTKNAPSEGHEARCLLQWASARIPRDLPPLVHIPNGGARNAVTGARLKAEGTRPGFPDYALFVPRGEFHGLFVELKKRKGGRISPAQDQWLDALRSQGYATVIAYGWEHAASFISSYLLLPPRP